MIIGHLVVIIMILICGFLYWRDKDAPVEFDPYGVLQVDTIDLKEALEMNLIEKQSEISEKSKNSVRGMEKRKTVEPRPTILRVALEQQSSILLGEPVI